MKRFIYALLVLFSISINAQNIDSAFLRFDLEKFQELQKAGLDYYYLEDSSKVLIGEYKEMFSVVIEKHQSHFYSSYQYFKTSLSLQRCGKFFQRNPIGIHRIYDKDHQLIEEWNTSKDFTYTIEELNKMLIKDYDLHIYDLEPAISVSIESSFQPIYNIAFHTTENPFGMWRFIQVDGKTGEIREDFEKNYECRAR